MKIPQSLKARAAAGPDSVSRGERGMALVLVLGFLVLISGLVLAFFSSVQNELASAKAYASGANTKQLADTAVQVVMGAIRTGTSRGAEVAWASQPGMIRTYATKQEKASSAPLAYYKLYSSDNMVVTQDQIESFKPEDDVPENWADNPALYTDLNSPVTDGDGNKIYPIIDGSLAEPGNNNKVDGFSVDNAPIATSGKEQNNIPMPVRWVYILRDGTLTAPDDQTGSSKTATWPKAKGNAAYRTPSATNPIVGRIAFWTDDETCKLNVNTACGGNPWDPPMFTTTMDMQFSRYVPAKNEFTRYPGHPATVSLLPVLWSFSGLSQPQTTLFPNIAMDIVTSKLDTMTSQQIVCDYSGKTSEETFQTQALLLNPRNAMGGTELAKEPTAGAGLNKAGQRPPIVQLDKDRLFASVDEAIFGSPDTKNARNENAFSSGQLNPVDLQKLRFFLTAHSRAPEVNMFNLPKVTMWPLPSATKPMTANKFSKADATRSAPDQLIAFCSTLNNQPYYFTRFDSTSPTNDFAPDSRNWNLYNYLDTLLKKPIPGFGGKIDGQSGRNGSQILTLISDYIRSDINLLDPSGGDDFTYPLSERFKHAYTTPPKAASATDGIRDIGTGQVVPALMPNNTKGIGRFPTIKSANLMFIARRANQPPVQVNAAMTPLLPLVINPMHPWRGVPPTTAIIDATKKTLNAGNQYLQHPGMPYHGQNLTAANGPFVPNSGFSGPALKPNETQMEAIFFIDPVNVGVGQVGLSCDYRIEVDGLDQLKIKARDGSFKQLFSKVSNETSEVAKFDNNPPQVGSVKDSDMIVRFGGDLSYDIGKEMHTIHRSSKPIDPTKKETLLNYWSGISDDLIVGPASSGDNTFGQAFDFQGGDVTVRFYPPTGSTLIQKITINFPSSKNGFPTPRLVSMKPNSNAGGLDASGNNTVTNGLLSFDTDSSPGAGPSRLVVSSSYINSPAYHFTFPESNNTGDTLGRYKYTVDTIRSVECKYGDTRLVAALADVPKSFFAPHKFYYDNLGTYDQAKASWSQPWSRSAHTLRRSGEDRYIQTYNGATTGATLHPLTDFLDIKNQSLSYYGDWGAPTGAPDQAKMMSSSWKSVPSLPSGFSFGNNHFYNNWPHTTSSVDFSDTGFVDIWNKGGDFDNGPVDVGDGPYINKPNEGTSRQTPWGSYSPDYEVVSVPPTAGVFSPNRQVPSSAMFGSLPRGVDPGNPTATLNSAWQTLLFCPNPNSKDSTTSLTHAGMDQVKDSLGGNLLVNGKAPDYLLLDFFHMPVVEPYAISEPFSTAGKVNMNYEIAPFSYIKRSTALRGVLASSLLTAVPDKWIRLYKNKYFYMLPGFSGMDSEADSNGKWYFKFPIHADQTLQQFQNRFDQGDIFHSASEICSIFLYPAKQPGSSSDVSTPLVTDSPGSTESIKNWWYSGAGGERKSLTGDNMRERPYALLYPLLTTKSNTYTVHFRVQTLKKRLGSGIPATDPRWLEWDDAKDAVLGDYRGSTLIERYIDPSDPDLPDFAEDDFVKNNPTYSLDYFKTKSGQVKSAYKFRILSTKKFGA